MYPYTSLLIQKGKTMKEKFQMCKTYLPVVLATIGFVNGCKIIFGELGKPNGMEAKYPLFLLTISLVAIYIIPLLVLTYSLAKRYNISKQVIGLSWLLGLTSSISFSELGHTAIDISCSKSLKLVIIS